MFIWLLCCFVSLVAIFTDVTIDFLVRMVTLVIRVTNVPVVTFATRVNQGYQYSLFAVVTRTHRKCVALWTFWASVSFVMALRLHGITQLPLDGFS